MPAADPTAEAWKFAAMKASILHLADLKRAGHSPKQTELRIAYEGAVILPMRGNGPARSLTGSPAADCLAARAL